MDKSQLGKLGSDLAVATACRDFFKTACEDIRRQVIAGLEDAYNETGADRLSLKIGETETAKATYIKGGESVSVVDQYAFEAWLFDNGKAEVTRRVIAEELPFEVIDWLETEYPSAVVADVRPEAGWDCGLSHGSGGEVVTADGEVVPGVAWVEGTPTIRVTKAKDWKDDAKTIRFALDSGAVAGLLEAAVS